MHGFICFSFNTRAEYLHSIGADAILSVRYLDLTILFALNDPSMEPFFTRLNNRVA